MKSDKEILLNNNTIDDPNKNSMNQSFYTKQGLDFLYFARPGTAYGPGAFMNSQLPGMT